MLSLQGAFIYQEMYGIFALIMGIFILAAAVTYRYRDAIYSRIEKIDWETAHDCVDDTLKQCYEKLK